LRSAAELEPERARYAYVYAVALHSAGRGADAMAVLKNILTQRPEDRDTLLALISFSRDAGDFATALEYAQRLARLTPNDANLAALIENLRQQVDKQPK
jgi:Flp pilus assembly protein TadD